MSTEELFMDLWLGVVALLVIVAVIVSQGKPNISLTQDFPNILTNPSTARMDQPIIRTVCPKDGTPNITYQVLELDGDARSASIRYGRSESPAEVNEMLDVWMRDRYGIILLLRNNKVVWRKKIGGAEVRNPILSHVEYEEIFGLIKRVREIAHDSFSG